MNREFFVELIDLYLCGLAHFSVSKLVIDVPSGKAIRSNRIQKFIVGSSGDAKIFVAAAISKCEVKGLAFVLKA